MANSITGIRIVLSVALLFCPALSPTFYEDSTERRLKEEISSAMLVRKGEALTTACGGSFVRAEVNRNNQSARWAVAQIEIAEDDE